MVERVLHRMVVDWVVHTGQPEARGINLVAGDSRRRTSVSNRVANVRDRIIEPAPQEVRPSAEGFANDPAQSINDHCVSLGASPVDSKKVFVFTLHWFVDIERSGIVSLRDLRSVNRQ
jgi:hypothetical protein